MTGSSKNQCWNVQYKLLWSDWNNQRLVKNRHYLLFWYVEILQNDTYISKETLLW